MDDADRNEVRRLIKAEKTLKARVKELEGFLFSLAPAIRAALKCQPPRPRVAGEPPGNIGVDWYTGRDNAEAILAALAGKGAEGG